MRIAMIGILFAAGCVQSVPDWQEAGADAGEVVNFECTDESQDALYERYVEPLVTGGQPDSCNQCHLSGVDLTMFVRETPCQSIACLAEQDLIDFDNPADSTILEWIMLAQPQSQLITPEIIQREYDGFKTWIEWSAECHSTVCGNIENACASGGGGEPPTGIADPLGGCDETSLGLAFQAAFQTKDRCTACHGVDAPENPDATAGEWIDTEKDLAGSLRTMYNMIGWKLFDPDDPENSLFLTKPLNEEMDFHGGGRKLEKTQQDYTDWLNFCELYASCY